MPEAEQGSATGGSPPPVSDLQYARVGVRVRPWGKGILSLAASFFLPGLGHVWAGEYRRGSTWFAALAGATAIVFVVMGLTSLLPALVVLVPLQLALTMCLWADAFLAGRRSRRRMLPHALLRYLAAAAFCILTYYLPPTFLLARWYARHVVQPYVIASGSMSPALQTGDRVFTHRRQPFGRWSVVAHLPPGKSEVYISRIVGLPGETVEIIDDTLHIDGAAVRLPEGLGPYVSVRYGIAPGTGCEGNPIHLGRDEYYLLSDNSRQALDARFWTEALPGHQLGAMPRSRIIGRVTAIYWPPSRWTLLNNDP